MINASLIFYEPLLYTHALYDYSDHLFRMAAAVVVVVAHVGGGLNMCVCLGPKSL